MCGGIWITGSKFGVTWKLSQCAVKPPETFEKGKCYIPGLATQDSTYGSDGEDEAPPKPEPVVEETVPQAIQEPAPEPAAEVPVPEPTETVAEPVKKVSKKKTAAAV